MDGLGKQLIENGGGSFLAGEFPAALDDWQQAFNLFVASNQEEGIQIASEYVAGALYHLGDYRQSMRYGRMSFEVSRTRKDKDGMSRALALLGAGSTELGDVQEAIATHQTSLCFALEIGDREGEVRARGNLAEAYLAAARFREAIDEINTALRARGAERRQRPLLRPRREPARRDLSSARRARAGRSGLRTRVGTARDSDDVHGESASLINRCIGHLLRKHRHEAISETEKGRRSRART